MAENLHQISEPHEPWRFEFRGQIWGRGQRAKGPCVLVSSRTVLQLAQGRRLARRGPSLRFCGLLEGVYQHQRKVRPRGRVCRHQLGYQGVPARRESVRRLRQCRGVQTKRETARSLSLSRLRPLQSSCSLSYSILSVALCT